MTEPEVHGPIDFLLLQFPGTRFPDAAADQMLELTRRGTIRLYDLLLVEKDANGTVTALDAGGASTEKVGSFAAFAGARSGMLNDDDLRQAADVMDAGSVGILIVFENTWAIPFVGAALEAGGQVIAGSRIPAQDVVDALDALDANT